MISCTNHQTMDGQSRRTVGHDRSREWYAGGWPVESDCGPLAIPRSCYFAKVDGQSRGLWATIAREWYTILIDCETTGDPNFAIVIDISIYPAVHTYLIARALSCWYSRSEGAPAGLKGFPRPRRTPGARGRAPGPPLHRRRWPLPSTCNV